jgi:hypothetical protein
MKLTMRSGAVGATVIAALVTFTTSVWPDTIEHSSEGPTVTGCAIRFDTPRPRIHENATHQCTGADGLEINGAGDLVIYSSTPGPVVSVVAEEDETLTALGIRAGASGGLGVTTVRLYDQFGGHVRADSPYLRTKTTNLWVLWVRA